MRVDFFLHITILFHQCNDKNIIYQQVLLLFTLYILHIVNKLLLIYLFTITIFITYFKGFFAKARRCNRLCSLNTEVF